MARYIDADKLWNDRPQFPIDQDAEYDAGFCDCYLEFSELIRKHIDNTATDVVPKREVEKIFKEFERLMENNEVWFRQTDEIREEFAELKKKYTGG